MVVRQNDRGRAEMEGALYDRARMNGALIHGTFSQDLGANDMITGIQKKGGDVFVALQAKLKPQVGLDIGTVGQNGFARILFGKALGKQLLEQT
jgi:hypothetical protein